MPKAYAEVVRRHMEATEGIEYGAECVIPVGKVRLCCPAYPDPCEYVRITTQDGREMMYWHADEWREEPEEVMGAILGMLAGGEEQ